LFKMNKYISICQTLQVIAGLACAASDGYNPDWLVLENQNAIGASQYHAAQSVQECLNHCGSQDKCVAVDVDLTQQPPTCWPHFSSDDLRPENVFAQQGTNQYRLLNRYASGPITGVRFQFYYKSAFRQTENHESKMMSR